VIPEGQCCPECQLQDCSTVECLQPPLCGFIGESLQIPEGECCPKCLPDPCAGILCVAPVCFLGEVAFTPEGECCAQCVPLEEPCATVECEPAQECRFILGQPTCIPAPTENVDEREALIGRFDPCAHVQCLIGSCQVIEGRAVCVVPTDASVIA
jgi:hypothetical protein